jgi:hypothetical protein
MRTEDAGRIEISGDAANMLESMPKEIAISVMMSLAINLIRMSKGELKGDTMPDNPIKLIAEVSAMITLHALVKRMEGGEGEATETVDKAKVH